MLKVFVSFAKEGERRMFPPTQIKLSKDATVADAIESLHSRNIPTIANWGCERVKLKGAVSYGEIQDENANMSVLFPSYVISDSLMDDDCLVVEAIEQIDEANAAATHRAMEPSPLIKNEGDATRLLTTDPGKEGVLAEGGQRCASNNDRSGVSELVSSLPRAAEELGNSSNLSPNDIDGEPYTDDDDDTVSGNDEPPMACDDNGHTSVTEKESDGAGSDGVLEEGCILSNKRKRINEVEAGLRGNSGDSSQVKEKKKGHGPFDLSAALKNDNEVRRAHYARSTEARNEAYDRNALAAFNSDVCYKCNFGGRLLCCDCCERCCHLACNDPPLELVPEGSWKCIECTAQEKEKVQSASHEAQINISEEASHPATALRQSPGRDRKWLNSRLSILRAKCGIFASFGMASIATKNGKVSHLVLNDQWNVLVSCLDEVQDMYVGVGAGKAKSGPLLAAVGPEGLPLFHAPKVRSKGDKRIYYVGHWAPIKDATKRFHPPIEIMKKSRQMLIRLQYVRHNDDIDSAMNGKV